MTTIEEIQKEIRRRILHKEPVGIYLWEKYSEMIDRQAKREQEYLVRKINDVLSKAQAKESKGESAEGQ